eukprot:CAMPEP_0177511722 /NCGR_PEP_ID=MMETSP0369-20130122/42832_1 /TAXON_ID=447022 ORGANISM="Scrippsiella hangoei-like, Strain SHHI-4" /NCGR_SAMPLE_ID=MMETSP0369 /ASSEMBLY_ACC=CAM_ASM_000364 /LENGTH=180 /DNA_ID=CAMNT_0018990159 /DNA_START=245 /DNA_END=784 /DNA_ORIENTATION=-
MVRQQLVPAPEGDLGTPTPRHEQRKEGDVVTGVGGPAVNAELAVELPQKFPNLGVGDQLRVCEVSLEARSSDDGLLVRVPAGFPLAQFIEAGAAVRPRVPIQGRGLRGLHEGKQPVIPLEPSLHMASFGSRDSAPTPAHSSSPGAISGAAPGGAASAREESIARMAFGATGLETAWPRAL